jgi:HAD superfamily hydrolase (TIGR01509 family)
MSSTGSFERPNSEIRGVLFDWRGTLVHDPPSEWWVRAAFSRARRPTNDDEIRRLCEQLGRAAQLPEILDAETTADCSLEQHRAWSMLYFSRAGLDNELAHSLYDVDLDPASHPFYPDAPAALHQLHDRGLRIAIVSDIHFDLRPEFASAGLGQPIDAFVLSFEHGVQKPDPAIFQIALEALDIEPDQAIMVGDRTSHDGGAVALGIATLLLPKLTDLVPRRLDRVLALVAAGT